ncbi:hypothetical protein GOP47_0021450 [Adiantum capillus-veneris]|uniref:TIR domain-containing protein n=1 Tax=Adiantum capillus-veneris TaxID=13818 RepID=A0A9D4Z586_ADICA|nr:hypothetical protein GOP47_0021450 [Adiantum capillus-veneris]
MERGKGSRAAAVGGRNYEAPPFIFLSHSGKQKDFVTDLYQALLRVRHRPFFDKDTTGLSLPPGRDYSVRIFQACHGCKMAVVVLSHDYIENLWPMLELQEFFLHDPERLIYPLFYELRPADLSNGKNMKRWKDRWSKSRRRWHQRMVELQNFLGPEGLKINLDIDKWEENLKKLQYRSGEVRLCPGNCDQYLCYASTASASFNGKDIKGMDMMRQEIVNLLERQSRGCNNSIEIAVAKVGVHGIGGFGKSTLCKSLADFFADKFCGKSWWLEFPSSVTDSYMNLVEQIKAILPSLSSQSDVSNLEQAMAALEAGLQRNKVFLALDNV